MKTLTMFQFEKYFTQRGKAMLRKEGLSAFENFAALREIKQSLELMFNRCVIMQKRSIDDF